MSYIVAKTISVIDEIKSNIDKKDLVLNDHFSIDHFFKLIINKTIVNKINGIVINSNIASKKLLSLMFL